MVYPIQLSFLGLIPINWILSIKMSSSQSTPEFVPFEHNDVHGGKSSFYEAVGSIRVVPSSFCIEGSEKREVLASYFQLEKRLLPGLHQVCRCMQLLMQDVQYMTLQHPSTVNQNWSWEFLTKPTV